MPCPGIGLLTGVRPASPRQRAAGPSAREQDVVFLNEWENFKQIFGLPYLVLMKKVCELCMPWWLENRVVFGGRLQETSRWLRRGSCPIFLEGPHGSLDHSASLPLHSCLLAPAAYGISLDVPATNGCSKGCFERQRQHRLGSGVAVMGYSWLKGASQGSLNLEPKRR